MEKDNWKMRKLKFKAWHKKEGKMLPPKSLAQISTLGEFEPTLNFDDLEWLQFTGLLDKSGKEIYEGDIAKDEKMGISEIEFFNASFTVSKVHFVIGKERANHMKVIGNIYENKELLKGVKNFS